jgi:hypothetical protein
VVATSSSASNAAIPKNKTAPQVRGTTQEGSVLNAEHGQWRSGAPLTFSYQWRRCLANGSGCVDVPKATDVIYAVHSDDVGHSLSVLVTARNQDGAASVVSAATAPLVALAATAPHNTVAPAITGPVAPAKTLQASAGTWTGAAPIAFSYIWRRCDAGGRTCMNTSGRAQSYTLSAGDAGHAFRVLVTAKNAVAASAALSDPTAAIVGPSRPATSSPPTVSGPAEQGKTLVGGRGAWGNNPSSFEYRWLRCGKDGSRCNAINGARGPSYVLGTADVGHTIRFQVTAKNAGGGTSAFSPATPVITATPVTKPAAPTNTSRPTISGTAQEGKVLTGTRGTWANNPTDYDYGWQRCNTGGNNCDGIPGAHSTTYTLTGNDVGQRIRFRVKARNSGGSAAATSTATTAIRSAATPSSSSPPTVSGTPQEGKTVTGERGSWTHNPTGFDYAWLRCDRTGGSCAAISGARNRTYTLVSADVGNTLRFRVTARNSEGATADTSVPTAVIQKAAAPTPPPPTNGCPSGNPKQVSAMSLPTKLIIDRFQASPSVLTRSTQSVQLRVHVTSTSPCGGDVQGALVYGTATPFNQFTIVEQPTDSSGWATLTFSRLTNFPVNGKQGILAMFLRARKAGENVLGGVTAYRLVSVRVSLR